MDGAIVAKGVEVVEQRGVAVAVAELEVVADAAGFVEVAVSIALRLRQRRLQRQVRLVYIGDDLILRGGDCELA